MKQAEIFTRFLLVYSILICLSSLEACVKKPDALTPSASELKVPDFDELVPGNNTPLDDQLLNPLNPNQPASGNFVAALERLGIQLTSAEIQALSQLTQVQPTGDWAPGRTLSAEDNLAANFQRFGVLFQPPILTQEDYRQRALAFAQRTDVPFYLDLQYYLDTKLFLVVKWDQTTKEFVVIQADGTLVNYLISSAITPPRYQEIDL